MTTLSKLNPADFETTHQGKRVKLIVLKNKAGAEACITNFGAILVSFVVPDKDGNMKDITLGLPNIKEYIEHSDRFLGATVGRVANRIGKGVFKLDGHEYHLPINNDINNNHTGDCGFHNNVWDIIEEKPNTCLLIYIQKDGADGWPGNLETALRITLKDDNDLVFDFEATTDKATPCAFTQHSFFNLTTPEEDVYDTEITANCDFYVPIDDHMCPTGEILRVDGTPFDFRSPMKIGVHIDDKEGQIAKAGGYDHTLCIRKDWYGQDAVACKAYSPKSGIVLELHTTSPGMVLYTANWMEGMGKNGIPNQRRHGFCLEPGMYPNSANNSQFPCTILRPGEKLHTVFGYKAYTA